MAKGPFVIRCGCTGGYLANGGRVVFRKAQARGFTLLERAEAAFRKEARAEDSLIGDTNPLGWEVLPYSKAEDLSV